jgi:hypothetical protein
VSEANRSPVRQRPWATLIRRVSKDIISSKGRVSAIVQPRIPVRVLSSHDCQLAVVSLFNSGVGRKPVNVRHDGLADVLRELLSQFNVVRDARDRLVESNLEHVHGLMVASREWRVSGVTSGWLMAVAVAGGR